LHLLECASNCKIDLFLNIGTFWQHFENNNYSPVNLYAASKQAFESLSKYYVELQNLKFVTLKINDSYGPNDTRNKILNLFDTCVKDNKEINMSPGNQLLNMLYIDDIVSAILLTILGHKKFEPGSEFILKSKNSYTVKEFAHIYMSLRKVKLKINWGALSYSQRECFVEFQNGTILPGWEEKHDIISGLTQYFELKKKYCD
jgi:nucleoside-diphosphate-sugar epimerase